MADRETRRRRGVLVRRDQPLIGVFVQEGEEGNVSFFFDEQAADDAVSQQSMRTALELAGAWKDMDWAAAEGDLDRIRHESQPTPPIDL